MFKYLWIAIFVLYAIGLTVCSVYLFICDYKNIENSVFFNPNNHSFLYRFTFTLEDYTETHTTLFICWLLLILGIAVASMLEYFGG
ncbi:MAG: hypothetical protein K5659_09070 [Lachnospiraceae bacterium]|nr:hypothetical protein [Lachnospiraceae bacterium]